MKSDISNQFRFECTQCGQCCSRPGVVMMTPVELVKIANSLSVTIEYIQQMCLEFDGQHWLLEVPEDSHCPFLLNNRCSVHSVKPEQCRTYPFWEEIVETDASWDAEAAFCPGIGHGKSYSLKQIRELVRGRGNTE